MATLDEKYLDGPNVGYCSDSDEEPPQEDAPDLSREQQAPRGSQQSAPQTGAKGVLAEYRREQQAARFAAKAAEQRLIKEAERSRKMKRREDELEAIRRRRLEQMQVRNAARIVEIEEKQEFLDAIEATKDGRRALIHIYRSDLEVTETLNEALMDMAAQCTGCSFFKVQPKVLDMSSRFNKSALPTVQVYENEELVGNFVRISDSIGDDFDARDLRRFFAQNGITFELRN
ncbi:Phosducin domain-containing protein [Aphelenchoides fujianensis]|nr:Phosducin domain-containing protein [Aphelenchoides fujianensis]